MATMAAGGQRFEMGRVVSRTFGTIGRNAALLVALVVAFYIVPSVLSQALLHSQLAAVQAGTVSPLAMFASPFYWLRLLVSVFIFFFMQGAVTHIALVDLDGRQPQIQATLRTALRVALPLFGLGILYTLGCYAGLILIFVPGLILLVMWSVAGVAMVAEGTGVFASFGRSRFLTKGYRWPIFGLIVILGVFYLLFAMGVGFSTGLVGASRTVPLVVAPSLGTILLQAVGGSILTLLATVGFSAIYAELRAVKEGATGASLATIFE